MSVMSSLRGLGAGISKFFQTASMMGSRAPSLTPPPSELTTLTTNSMVAPPQPGALVGQAWGPSAGGAPPQVSGGGGGGGGSGGGAAGAAVPPSPSASVLGASPATLATLATRMRLMRQPLPAALQLGAMLTPPPTHEMSAVRSSGGSEPGGSSGAATSPAAAAPAAAAPPPLPSAATPHGHHHRVAHMRTITEENLDLLLRPGSSGGIDALGGPLGPGAAAGVPSNLGRPELLVLASTAEGQEQAAAAAGEADGPNPAHVSPFASCDAPPPAQPLSEGGAQLGEPQPVGATPPAACSWPGTPPSQQLAAVGPAAVAAAVAAAAGPRYPPSASAAAPEDLRLVLQSPRRLSSADVSDGALVEVVEAADGLDAWPTDALHMGAWLGRGLGRARPRRAGSCPWPAGRSALIAAPLAHHLLPTYRRGRPPRGVPLVEGAARGVPAEGRQRVRLGSRRLRRLARAAAAGQAQRALPQDDQRRQPRVQALRAQVRAAGRGRGHHPALHTGKRPAAPAAPRPQRRTLRGHPQNPAPLPLCIPPPLAGPPPTSVPRWPSTLSTTPSW
jgi:hypothetical protein